MTLRTVLISLTYFQVLTVPVLASSAFVQTLNEQSRLSVAISNHDLNRIAVQGDRIQQVFGADGRFHVETDEESGQLFIKPVHASDSKPLYITLITENGMTQDLKLLPQAREATSLILKSTTSTTKSAPHSSGSSENHVGQLMELMRTAVTHQQKHALVPCIRRALMSSLTSEPIQCWKSDRYRISSYRLTNSGTQTMTLTESQFVHPQDVAIALGMPTLQPQASTNLIIIEGGE